MNVSLPMALEEFVRRKVAGGEFHSVDEVVCEGLLLLQEQDAWKVDAREKIDVGWNQAKADQLQTPTQIRENLAQRQKAWKSSFGG